LAVAVHVFYGIPDVPAPRARTLLWKPETLSVARRGAANLMILNANAQRFGHRGLQWRFPADLPEGR
jgi:hypothetical protein